MKIRELQGKDTSEDVPDEVLWLKHEPEQIPDVQSDTRIAEPDTVSIKEDNVEGIPSPPTTETSVSPDVPAPSATEGVNTPPSSTTENEVTPSLTTEGDVPLQSTTENDVPQQTSEATAATESEDVTKTHATTDDSNGVDSKGL